MRTKWTRIVVGVLLPVGLCAATGKGLPEKNARLIMLNKCSHLVSLSEDTAGNWHGTCSVGLKSYIVTPSGQVLTSAAKPAAHR